jgi:hypothetical protein
LVAPLTALWVVETTLPTVPLEDELPVAPLPGRTFLTAVTVLLTVELSVELALEAAR